MMILDFLSTTSIFLFIIVILVGLGIGIIRAIDYIEENPHAAKSKIQAVLYLAVALHLFFLIIEVPLYHIIFSLSIHYTFNSFFSTYPVIKPEDPRFIYGVLGSFINHFLLIRFFFNKSPNILSVILSFFVIWITPFSFFFSMSAAEDTLFVNRSKKDHKTYAGMALNWLLTLGKKSETNKD